MLTKSFHSVWSFVHQTLCSIFLKVRGLNKGPLKLQPYEEDEDEDKDKEKVIVVMGATGTGKSKLSIDLATRFPSEIINADKIQVYKGLDIVTNKVTDEESRGVPHHMLSILDPEEDFTVADFCRYVNVAVGSIIEKGKVPIIVGGSNSFIEALINNDASFGMRYECCFLWVDVSLPVLEAFVWERVDRMVEAGLVEEIRATFEPESDYSKGVKRAIGVPELDRFFKLERSGTADKQTLDKILKDALEETKVNTYVLACKQREKIQRLRDVAGWELHQVDATNVSIKRRKQEEGLEACWQNMVLGPSAQIVDRFLHGSAGDDHPVQARHLQPAVADTSG